METKKINKCPFCNSENVAEILYGLPVGSKQLDKELESKKMVLGGCMISDDSPLYKCNDCQKKFGEKI
jgi:transposase-like protein